MTEGPGVQVKETLVSTWSADSRVKEDELFDVVGALREAAALFEGLTEESFMKESFRGRGRCIRHVSGFCKPDALNICPACIGRTQHAESPSLAPIIPVLPEGRVLLPGACFSNTNQPMQSPLPQPTSLMGLSHSRPLYTCSDPSSCRCQAARDSPRVL